jgi:DedD protein
MPPDLPNEQALILKKRARRRLVGAIALVLLMIIILPRILQDRANQTTQESIKITMPAEQAEPFNSAVTPTVPEPQVEEPALITEQKTEAEIENIAAKQAEPVIKPPVTSPATTAKPETIKSEQVSAEPKPLTKPVGSTKTTDGFTVQVGVFSDAANVKQLQDKLKQAGFSSYTEKISTPGGQKIRLRAGQFATRQEASDALTKIKSAGLSGMVISN